jgi:hypothetical protein
MQRESTSKPGKAKPGVGSPSSSNKMTLESASVWGTPAKRSEPAAAAPAPTWSRYVDSRLKQFCTR